MSNRHWIGVDLDGTLAHYDGWKGIDHIGAPIPAMVDRVKQWLSEGRCVKVFTARVAGIHEKEAIETVARPIIEWCQQHIGCALDITCVKDYGMIQLWDDRCVQVETNTGRMAKL